MGTDFKPPSKDKKTMSTFQKIIFAESPEDASAAIAAYDASALEGDMAAIREVLGGKAKGESGKRVAAYELLSSLVTVGGAKVLPALVSLLQDSFNGMADKAKPVCKAAKVFVKAVFEATSASSVPALAVVLSDIEGQKRQALEFKMVVLKDMAAKFVPETSRQLTLLVPLVAGLMWHDKPQTKDAAIACMTAVSSTVDNRDIEDSIPELMAVISDPANCDELVQKLAGIIFVQEIKSEALSIMLPVLTRSLNAQAIIPTKRQAARIVENMCKLIDDPRECQVFLPKIKPLLEKAMVDVPDPECREVCEKAFNQLVRSGDMSNAAKGTSVEAVKELLGYGAASDFNKLTIEFGAYNVSALADLKNFDEATWTSSLSEYVPADKIAELLALAIKNNEVVEEEEEDDGAELLCDCDFSLAFGSNQIEGFPDPTQVRTIFVETDVQGDLSELSVIDYLFNHPMLANCGVSKEKMSETLISVGFGMDGPAAITKQVGRLSGGWRMKLALARAMLLNADILMLDEPTNHLDPMNRNWVEDYLINQTNVSMIMVSHDAGFLERVCTNMLHIDNLKLKSYP